MSEAEPEIQQIPLECADRLPNLLQRCIPWNEWHFLPYLDIYHLR